MLYFISCPYSTHACECARVCLNLTLSSGLSSIKALPQKWRRHTILYSVWFKSLLWEMFSNVLLVLVLHLTGKSKLFYFSFFLRIITTKKNTIEIPSSHFFLMIFPSIYEYFRYSFQRQLAIPKINILAKIYSTYKNTCRVSL